MKTITEIIQDINEDSFIISDPHLFHGKILSFERCRAEEMLIGGFNNHEDWLASNWNSVVGESDNVLCLGDFAFKMIKEASLMLNGNKTLIFGNHDRGKQAYTKHGWNVIDGVYCDTEIGPMRLMKGKDHLLSGLTKEIMGQNIMFCHYPLFSNDKHDRRNDRINSRMNILEKVYAREECTLNFHGHTHSRQTDINGAVNCCVENVGFKPVKIGSLLKEC